MVELRSTLILAQEEMPSFFRLLVPVVTVVLIVVFGWVNERVRKKQEEQQREEELARRRQEAGGPTRQVRAPQVPQGRPAGQPGAPRPRAPGQVRTVRREQIHRYQPEIPGASQQAQERRVAEEAEPELVIVAEDVNSEAARQRFQQEQLRAAAARRARALQVQQRRQAAQEARQDAAREKAAQESRPRQAAPRWEAIRPGQLPSVEPTGEFSVRELRGAIIWAEILGQPRAMRPLEQLF